MSKSPDEALDFLNYVAKISRSWDEPHGKDSSKVKPQNNAKGGMYTLNEDVDVQVKMATLSRRLEELEARGANEIKVVNDVPMQIAQCSICQSGEHLVSECPTIPAVREMFMEQANVVGFVKHSNSSPFSNTYNPGGGIIQIYLGRVDKDNFLLTCKLLNLKLHACYFQTHKYAYGARKGKFPSQPQQNPRGVHEIGEKNENSAKVDEVKAIITLRGGKQVDQPMPKPKENKGGNKKKIGLNINKKAFLTEQVSAIIQCKTPIKYKDPGCPTISVNIGDTYVEKALLDLGASVNLLPYSVYKQLGLGELKPTSITLSLADRSIKIPRGMIEDLTFGNMTLELNIFHLCKRHPNQDEDEQEEACLIDTLIEEHVEGIKGRDGEGL
ncbi:hypothetical protein CK203_040538 [Vitis vinifera]|uniref:Retrotransposon gag domain-containing protein n=1 Tax=Vitis vinifera TaxID=29760 RepID=A0A438HHV6_VITVI|nr:hypothetical protein CK203_040538 [Vitis vinifera]